MGEELPAPAPAPAPRRIRLTALIAGSPPFQQQGNSVICVELGVEANIYVNEDENIRVSYKGMDSPSRWVIEQPEEFFSVFVAGKIDFIGLTPEGVYKDTGGVIDYIEVAFMGSAKKRGGLVAILNQNQRG